MNALITITPPSEVTGKYKKEAKAWTKWDSEKKKGFDYDYTNEERILILEGSATLTPVDGSDPLTIKAGNAVTFHKGFECTWEITKRMKKHYAIFANEEDQVVELPAITCDVCKEGCVEESYFVKGDELDICLKCYEKDKDKYSGAEHQKGGEAWVEPKAATKKKGKQPPKKKQKKG